MTQQQVTLVPTTFEPDAMTTPTIQSVLKNIKEGGYAKPITAYREVLKQANAAKGLLAADKENKALLQSHGDLSKRAKKMKGNLPAFLHGTFAPSVKKEHYIAGTAERLIIDIDNINPDKLSALINKLTKIECVAFAFKSPSGNGIKIGINVSPIVNNDHCGQIYEVAKKFILGVDPALIADESCKNIGRFCYVSDDKDAYINDHSIVLQGTAFDEALVIDVVAVPPSILNGELMPVDLDTSELCCIKVSTMILNAPDGRCHAARLRAGTLAGGYVAGGLVDVAEIIAAARRASDVRDPTGETSATEWKAFTDGYTEGLKVPIKVPILALINDFEIVTTDKDGNSKTVILQRDKHGQLKTDLTNISKALSTPEFTGYTFGYDTFTQDLMFQHNNSSWQPFDNNTLSKIRLTLDKKGFKRTNKADIKDLIECIGDENTFDAAIDWADALPAWDGVPRVNTFMSEYFKTENTTFTRAVGAYLWTALVARTYNAGCKADMTIVLCGDQGFRKSTAIETLVQSVDQYAEIDFNDGEDKTTRNLRGKQIAEISELRGLNTRDADTIKAFMTRRIDVIIPKFKERAVSMPRRYIAIGTSNEEAILADTTGSRRWLPVTVTALIDSEAIVAVRGQLWAEGKVMYKLNGIMYQEAETLGKTENIKYEITDVWAESVISYLRTHYNPDVIVTDILSGCLDIPKGRQTKRDEMRVANILKVIRYTLERKMTNGMRLYRWHRPDSFKYVPTVGDAQLAGCEDVF